MVLYSVKNKDEKKHNQFSDLLCENDNYTPKNYVLDYKHLQFPPIGNPLMFALEVVYSKKGIPDTFLEVKEGQSYDEWCLYLDKIGFTEAYPEVEAFFTGKNFKKLMNELIEKLEKEANQVNSSNR